MKFSIIICAKNEEQNIAEMLTSIGHLQANTRDYEVILVNDHSNDRTIEIAQESDVGVRVLKTIGQGVAATRNTGISVAKGNILVFVDCDGVLDSKCLMELSAKLANPQTDIVQGNIWEQYYNTNANKWLSLWRKVVFMEKMMNKDGTLNSFNGRLLAIRVSSLKKLTNSKKVFDSSLSGAGGEDRECGERMYKKGAVIKLASKAIIRHKDPTNICELIKKKFKNGIADSKAGVGEKLFDINNFIRAVVNPWKYGVPLWLCFSFWFMYIAGNLYYQVFHKSR
ncbi:MAG: glycosyltransferase family 2 protein [Candidatus Shapirobacteria bacterium]